MNNEIKYCKFCNKEKPIKEFVKSGFAIRNICRECQSKKQTQIYRDSKKVKELEKQIQKYKEAIDNAILELANIDGNLYNSQLSDRICNLIDILKEVE